MWRNFFGNILSLLVDVMFVYSAYLSAPIYSEIWEKTGVVPAALSLKAGYLVMAIGTALMMSWVRRIFK